MRQCLLFQALENTFKLKPAVLNSLEALDNLPHFKSVFSNRFALIRIEVDPESILGTLAVRQEYASPSQSTIRRHNPHPIHVYVCGRREETREPRENPHEQQKNRTLSSGANQEP